jgi:osmotically-inducible protein OsmY
MTLRSPLLIARAYGATGSIAFSIPGRPGGLAGEELCALARYREDTHAMSQTKDIRDAVERELSYDPLVNDSDISVKNLNGDVALNGTVPTYPQYLEAAAAARRVTGVNKLQNHLEVVLVTGDYRDDATLTTTANDALTLNVAVPDGVEATARDGNLTLTGTVTYGTERTAAEQAVTYLTGVRNVKDDIDISAGADPADVTVAVQDALDRSALIPDDSDVAIDTSGNTVTLTGHVRTWAEHDTVLDATWMAAGVYDVRDDLSVTG